MRTEPALALLILAGCGADQAPAEPDPATVEVLADVQLAEARAALARADEDSARQAALAARGITPEEFARMLDRAARDAEASVALWEAVAGRLDAQRLAGSP